METEQEPDFFTIKFSTEALADFREIAPDLPPGDEIMLKIRPQPCASCGKEFGHEEMGAIGPDYITEDGELIGKFWCLDCMREGRDV